MPAPGVPAWHPGPTEGRTLVSSRRGPPPCLFCRHMYGGRRVTVFLHGSVFTSLWSSHSDPRRTVRGRGRSTFRSGREGDSFSGWGRVAWQRGRQTRCPPSPGAASSVCRGAVPTRPDSRASFFLCILPPKPGFQLLSQHCHACLWPPGHVRHHSLPSPGVCSFSDWGYSRWPMASCAFCLSLGFLSQLNGDSALWIYNQAHGLNCAPQVHVLSPHHPRSLGHWPHLETPSRASSYKEVIRVGPHPTQLCYIKGEIWTQTRTRGECCVHVKMAAHRLGREPGTGLPHGP